MTKKDAIAEAYGIFYNPERIHYSINGWIGNEHRSIIKKMQKNGIQLEFGETRVRPLSLQGIEDNNGWIKVKSEDDLPNDFEICEFIPCDYFEDRFIGWINRSVNEVFFLDKHHQIITDSNGKIHNFLNSWLTSQITHFKKIELSKNPIY